MIQCTKIGLPPSLLAKRPNAVARIGRRATCLLLAAVLGSSAYASEVGAKVEKFVVLSIGDKVGNLDVVKKNSAYEIDFSVVNNGRGPKAKEKLVIGADGIPTEWRIDGNSLMGGEVHESMQYRDGTQSWSSQAEKGTENVSKARLYIGNDASPWALGMYARALLKVPGGTLKVLPGGEISLRKVRDVALEHGKEKLKLTAYVLTGISLNPKFVLLDQKGDLFALPDYLLVRAGYEKLYTQLAALEDSLASDYLSALKKKLAHETSGVVRIKNVHIFDGATGKVGPLSSVYLFRGKVTRVSVDADNDIQVEKVIDGNGGTLVPGLHDMHAHNSAWSGLFNIAAGVTTTRDLGNENDRLLSLEEKFQSGELMGPDIVRAGMIEGPGKLSIHLGFVPKSVEEGKRNVQWYANHGYRGIKIYNSMPVDWIKPLIDEAHRLGMTAQGHVPAFVLPDQLLQDGYAEITHVNQLMLGWLLAPGEDTRTTLRLTGLQRAADLDLNSAPVRKTLALMKEKNAGLDTTIALVEQLMMGRGGEIQPGAVAYFDHMPIGVQRNRKRGYVRFADDAEKARYGKAFEKILETLTLMHKQGIPFWPGTDDDSGLPLHRELELYVKIGMTPAEALRVATLDCARYLGRDQNHGAIAPGKNADFFLVPGDPTADIGLLHKIQLVAKDKAIYYPNEIYESVNIKPFSPPLP